MALAADGTVWAWGYNPMGQLGCGNDESQPVPVPVVTDSLGTPLGGIVAIAAGADFTLALDGQGRVWAWGSNASGQLGVPDAGGQIDAGLPSSPFPGLVQSAPSTVLDGIASIAAGGETALAVKAADGRLWAWGDGTSGQLGTGEPGATAAAVPAPVQTNDPDHPVLTSIVKARVGPVHALALDGQGGLWVWGNNNEGELGTGGNLDSSPAAQLLPMTPVANLSAGRGYSLALSLSNGGLLAWGDNTHGQLGLPDHSAQTEPSSVPDLQDSDGDGIPDWWETAAGLNPHDSADATLIPAGENDSYLNLYAGGGTPPGYLSGGGAGQPAAGAPPDPAADDDHDGLSNQEEAMEGTNPHNVNEDSDGDGVLDGADAWPLEKTLQFPRQPVPTYAVIVVAADAGGVVNGGVDVNLKGQVLYNSGDSQSGATSVWDPADPTHPIQLQPPAPQAHETIASYGRGVNIDNQGNVAGHWGDTYYAGTEYESSTNDFTWNFATRRMSLGGFGVTTYEPSFSGQSTPDGDLLLEEFRSNLVGMSPNGSLWSSGFVHAEEQFPDTYYPDRDAQFTVPAHNGQMVDYQPLAGSLRDWLSLGVSGIYSNYAEAVDSYSFIHNDSEAYVKMDFLPIANEADAPVFTGTFHAAADGSTTEVTLPCPWDDLRALTNTGEILTKDGLLVKGSDGKFKNIPAPRINNVAGHQGLMWNSCNNSLEAIGTTAPPADPQIPVVLINDHAYALQTLVPAQWNITSATKVTDNGLILAQAKKVLNDDGSPIAPPSQAQSIVLLLPVEIKIKKAGTAAAPVDGLVVKVGDTLEYQLTDTPEESFPVPKENIKWYQQQLNSDGTYTAWQDIGATARGVKFQKAPMTAGIFQVKAEMTVGQQIIPVIFDRDRNDPFPSDFGSHLLKKGDPDAVGVVATPIQISIRDEAKKNLGSNYYAAAGALPPINAGQPKCNIFVAHKAGDAGAIVPWFNGNNPFNPYPPVANQWAGIAPDATNPAYESKFTGWALLPITTPPQPGFVAASGFDSWASGHCGIVDYDGRWISAGPSKVNRGASFQEYRSQDLTGKKRPAGQRQFGGTSN